MKHEGQCQGGHSSYTVPAVDVEVWSLTYLEVPVILGGGILGFAFYFVSKERTQEILGCRDLCTNAVQYGFQWHSDFFLSSKK